MSNQDMNGKVAGNEIIEFRVRNVVAVPEDLIMES